MTHFRVHLAELFVVGAVVAVAAACGGSEPEPSAPIALAPTLNAAPTAAPTASAAPTAAPSASASPLAALEPALASAAQAVLNEVARAEAPGAKPAGATKVGLLGAGQQSELAATLQPGKCYTIVAVGLPPVAEVNVQLLPATGVPGLDAVLAQDQGTGPQAILGKAPNCYKWALPVAGPVRVVTTVAVGQGLVATQVYEK